MLTDVWLGKRSMVRCISAGSMETVTPRLPGGMTVHAVLPDDLAHAQRAERGDIALAGQIRRQVRDTVLNLSHLSDQSDGEDQVGEHCQ